MPADKERALQYAQKLGDMLRFETISDENDLLESSFKAISALAEKYCIESEVIEQPVETRLSDMNTKAFRLVEDAVSASFEDVHTAPYIMTGCSDARFMERLGDSCFRFVPFLISHEQMESIHGLNECVDVDTLPGAVDFYKFVMRGSGNV